MIKYNTPTAWLRYDSSQIFHELTEAKAAILALRNMPYQKEWVEGLQKLQIIREVAGTSRIEGAEFTEKELEVAMTESATELETRSQRQARAASNTYQWIEAIPDDRPINRALIEEIHRRIVTGADDDHCPPGELRKAEENVNFGQPRHRGCEGGAECEKAFSAFLNAIQTTYKEHDPLVQALGMHFHLAAMHPFLDGNGRTVRALEALYLQRAGLRQSCFIAMSNYYYEEKNAYLASLSSVSRQTYDLTPFLKFGLKGIALQTRRLLREIEQNVQKALFANLMHDLFARLKSPRKRVIAERQLKTLKIVLAAGEIKWSQLREQTAPFYSRVKDPHKAQIRDINGLGQLKTLKVQRLSDGDFSISANLEWPTLITHTEFFEQIRNMPTAKGQQFLR